MFNPASRKIVREFAPRRAEYRSGFGRPSIQIDADKKQAFSESLGGLPDCFHRKQSSNEPIIDGWVASKKG